MQSSRSLSTLVCRSFSDGNEAVTSHTDGRLLWKRLSDSLHITPTHTSVQLCHVSLSTDQHIL